MSGAKTPNRRRSQIRQLAHLVKEVKEKKEKTTDVFAWTSAHITGVPRVLMIGGETFNTEHWTNVFNHVEPIKQKRSIAPERNEAIHSQVEELIEARILREVKYQTWVSNPMVMKKDNEKWKLRIDFTNINKTCIREPHPLPAAEQKAEGLRGTYQKLIDKVFGHQMGRNMEVNTEDVNFLELPSIRRIGFLDTEYWVFGYGVLSLRIQSIDQYGVLGLRIRSIDQYGVLGFWIRSIDQYGVLSVSVDVDMAYSSKWRLLKNPSALWVKVVKSIHGDEADIDLKGCQTNGIWARIVGSIFYLHSSGIVPLNSIIFKDWCRPVTGGRAFADLNNLLTDFNTLTLSDGGDKVFSSLSTDGIYSVSEVRKHIDDHLLLNSLQCTRWFKVILRNVNIFMWRFFLDRLPHRLNLSSRGLDIDSIMCPLCKNNVDSNAHVFFSCDITSNVWNLVRGWCDAKFPLLSSCEDWESWFLHWHASNDAKVQAYVIFASTCWVLWHFRNNVAFHSQVMRKCDIFDTIRLFSFYWLKFRGKMSFSWTDWLKLPL
nr:RNA-directed DNA polymerase, eukaryota [Tanacetum cinerariifolium]